MPAPLLWYQDAPDTKPPAVAKALSKTACKAIGIFREANDKNDTKTKYQTTHPPPFLGGNFFCPGLFFGGFVWGAQISDLTGGFKTYAFLYHKMISF